MKMTFYKAVLLTAIGMLFCVPNHASGDILNFTGSVEVVALGLVPSSITEGNWENDSFVRVFQERDSFTLPSPVAIDIAVPGLYGRTAGFVPSTQSLGLNTPVDSYLFHFDPVGVPANMTRIATVTFDSDVLGIIVGVQGGVNRSDPNNTLGLSNAVLGAPGITYDFAITDLFVGGGDQISLSSDRRTVGFTMISGPGSDNMRIITAVPEPTSVVLTLFACISLLRPRRINRFLV